MRSEGSRFTGDVGVKLCSLEVVQPSATVRTRPQASATSQPFATVRNRSCEGRMAVPIGSFPGVVILGRFTCHVKLRFAWHFVTCGGAWWRVGNHFAWQAQYFCDVFRTCVAFFVAGAAFWTCPASFFVAGAALQMCRASCLSEIALARLWEVVTECKLRGRRGILRHVLKYGGKPRSIYGESCKTCASEGVTERVWLRSIYGGSYKPLTFRSCWSVKIGGSLARNARFQSPTCVILCRWLSSGFAVSMREATKPGLFEVVEVSNLEEVSHEMLAFRLPDV